MIYLVPFYLENDLRKSDGNMGLHGLFLSIYYRRNIVYIAAGLCLVSWFFPSIRLISAFVFVCSLYYYFNHRLWKFVYSQSIS